MDMQNKVFSVTELNTEIKKLTAAFFPNILLEAEISSIKYHYTGNVYLTLKDDDAVLDAVIFKNYLQESYKKLKEGTKIKARGAISVHVKGGRYSFSIRELQVEGQGALYQQFLKLKEKLDALGLFLPEHKKPLPFLPSRIGVVTAPDGAAFKDILKVTKRRFPATDILLFPAQVQGQGAAESIRNAILAANALAQIDLLIVGRGGGSYDDLSVFNDEALAYAIFNSTIPIISAVGHEQDFTIADFVADLRAATPSQAAELALADKEELLSTLKHQIRRMSANCENKLRYASLSLKGFAAERLTEKLFSKIQNFSRDLDYYKEKMQNKLEKQLKAHRGQLELIYHKLEKQNPLYILSRHYAIPYDKNGAVIRDLDQVNIQETISIRLKDGLIKSVVNEKIRLN